MVFESDKFVLTKYGVYVDKNQLVNGFFKANVTIVDKKIRVFVAQTHK